MKLFKSQFFKLHWPKLLLVFFFILLLTSYVRIFAIDSPYDPGQTLDPACPPGEENCTVNVGGGSSPITIVNSSNLFSTGLTGTGAGVTIATFSNFFGENAGNTATSAHHSNFLGSYAGYQATSAFHSNFLGENAGNTATGASYSNFIGASAGNAATGASSSNFLGFAAGSGATFASSSNFLGFGAGQGATNALGSNFFGENAGNTATSAHHSNFLGGYAGQGAASAHDSNFLGYAAGRNATNAPNSNFIGLNAGNGAFSAFDSNFFGHGAGQGAAGAYDSNFLGWNAGQGATNADDSNFLGWNAGQGATFASSSNFLGFGAGQGATNALGSNFLGSSAGANATFAYQSNFLGSYAGQGATRATSSNFIGAGAGQGATNALGSNFIGSAAGNGATTASNSIFIGQSAGNADTVDNTGSLYDWSILLGYNTKTGGNKNSILLGGSSSATPISNTKANQFMLAPTVTEMRLRGIDYTLPSLQGAVSTVLTNDGSGGLSWVTASAISSPITVVNSSNLFSTGLTGTGAGVTAATYSNFFGENAGNTATSAHDSNFFGHLAGYYATSANDSNFIGNNAGVSATFASFSNFLGYTAGSGAASAHDSNFLGYAAGKDAINASNSNFFGYYAGRNATTASNSIFIGQNAGNADTVNNTGSLHDWSILLGYNTRTGGNKNSILLGGSSSATAITNTKANQFMLAPSVTEMRLRSVDYTLPEFQGGASTVLTNDGSGGLTWAAGGGGVTPTDNILDWDATNSWYAPYTVQADGKFDSGIVDPIHTTRLNYDGYYYATRLYGDLYKLDGTTMHLTVKAGDAVGAAGTGAGDLILKAGDAIIADVSSTEGNIYLVPGATPYQTRGTIYLGQPSQYGSVAYIAATGMDANVVIDISPKGIGALYLGSNTTNNVYIKGTADILLYSPEIILGAKSAALLIGSSGVLEHTSGYNVSIKGGTGYYTGNNNGGDTLIYGGDPNGSGIVGNIYLGTGSAGTNPLVGTGTGTSVVLYDKTTGQVTYGDMGIVQSDVADYVGAFINDGDLATHSGLLIQSGLDDNTAAGPSTLIGFKDGDGTLIGSITFGSSAVAYNTTSDERLKTLVNDQTLSSLNILNQIKIHDFTWNNDTTQNLYTGVFAQELYDIYPHAVTKPINEADTWMVDYSKLTPVIIASIQELDLKVKDFSSLDITSTTSLGSLIKNFLADVTNGITDLYASVIHSDKVETKTLCIGDTCVTEEQFLEMVNKSVSTQSPAVLPITPSVVEDTLPTLPSETPPAEGTPVVPPVVEEVSPVVSPEVVAHPSDSSEPADQTPPAKSLDTETPPSSSDSIINP